MTDDMAPPGYSLPKVIAAIKKSGPLKAMDDIEMGPHVHLTYLLIMVACIALIISAVVFFL
jgi:hypothetical protein